MDGNRAFVRAEPRGAQVPEGPVIKAWFEQYGEVSDVYAPIRTPDIAYVTFRSAKVLDHLIDDAAGGTLMVGEQECTITRAMPRGSPGAAVGANALAGGLGQAAVGAPLPAWLAAQAGAGAGGYEPQRGPGQSLSESSTRIYVTGPVQHLGDEGLRSHFGQFGYVRDVYIPMDHTNGLQKPFAFVTMNTVEEQQLVLALPTHQLTEEICVNVTYAAPRSGGKGGDAGQVISPGTSFAGGGFASGGFAGGGFAGGGFSGVSAAPPLRNLVGGLGAAELAALGINANSLGVGAGSGTLVSGPPGSANGPKQGVPGNHRIFVLGMPDGLSMDMLRGHFARHGEILDIYIPGRSPDLAYITFGSELEMQDAIMHSGLEIAGFQVTEVKMAAPKESTPWGKGGGKRAGPY